MNSIEIIKDIIKEVLNESEMEIDMLADFSMLGLNSFDFINVVVEIEDKFGIEFDDEYLDYNRYKTFEEFCTYVENLQID